MGRLFWKIFLWFWGTLILIGLTVAWSTAIYLHNNDELQRPDLRSRIVHQRVKSIKQVIRFAGAEASYEMLKQKRRAPFRLPKIHVLNAQNEDILGQRIYRKNNKIHQHGAVQAPNGEVYHVISSHKATPPRQPIHLLTRPFQRNPSVFILWLGIALLLSGLVCFWLAWYLSKPIRSLQLATQKLSQGHFDTRVSHIIGNRRDEIADLGHDFDVMAERLQNLINNQKQLLSDVSHELRSPLARLQVALGLAYKKVGSHADIELQRIEHESNRLDDLIGQSLTLSRLDAGAAYPKDDYIDIAALLTEIIKDCDYEAQEQQKSVIFQQQQTWTLQANGELLRRALENIIRNAIHYTNKNTTVDVSLTPAINNAGFIINICDHGSGVAEDKLDSLFEPFVRLSSARERDSGGYGLGLAIAKRAIKFHQGHIKAYNNITKGLCMKITIDKNTIEEDI